MTLGLGGFIGMEVSGRVVGSYAIDREHHYWDKIWLVPAIAAGVVMVLFALLFHDRVDTTDKPAS